MMEKYYPDVTEVREVFAQFGIAMNSIQSVERQLAILLAVNPKTSSKEEIVVEIQDMLDLNFQKTLGKLIRELQKNIDVPLELESSLEEGLTKRNWVVHHYFWDRAIEIITEEGRIGMINELDRLTSFFKQLDKELTNLTMKFNEKFGVTEATVQQELEEILRAAFPAL